MTDFDLDGSPLRSAIERAAKEQHCSLGDLTVLAAQNDPFRLDTPSRHRDGKWLADTADRLGLGDRKKHLRGLHYMCIGESKPSSDPYMNTDDDWLWLSGDCAKAARFLGYIPWEQIPDLRNAEPVIREFSQPEPWPYLSAGLDVTLPDVADIMPVLDVDDFTGTQPYHIVMGGEKASLDDVLGPIAQAHAADLYLPTGEMSDSLIYRIAKTSVDDGRPTVVLWFGDSDPAGHQMTISVARKLQAMNELIGPFDYQVHRVALTPAQVKAYGLPSSPLKATERRADRWERLMGVQQTEIDALASLRPELLRRIARDAIAPFFDSTLARRVNEARARWLVQAREVITRDTDSEALARIRQQAAGQLEDMQEQIDALNDQLRFSADDYALPEIEIPEPELDGEPPEPLISSDWSFARQSLALINSKRYGGA